MTVERDVETSMRDGTILRCDVYRPADGKPHPVLLQRTTYGKHNYAQVGEGLAAQGYITIFQDVRGQFASDGLFEPWINEGDDGFDTIAWAAGLPGSTGKVGTFGASYSGACQWLAALRRPPGLAAMLCQVTPADYFDQWVFPGGAFALAFNETWLLHDIANSAAAKLEDGAALQADMNRHYHGDAAELFTGLPLNGLSSLRPERREVAGYYFDWINRHATRDDYWKAISLRGRHGEIDLPVLNMGGWYDVFVSGTVENFVSLQRDGASRQARDAAQLVVGPWAHMGWGPTLGDVDFGPDAVSPYPAMARAFFDRWLKNIEPTSPPSTVQYFVMGSRTWKTAQTWPPPDTVYRAFYLDSDGAANSLAGNGRLVVNTPTGDQADHFSYDPLDPVPSVGGQSCCFAPQSPFGPYDQSVVEQRADVLVFTTEPLTSAIEIAGPVTLLLYAASDAVDTDFTAKLVDVDELGRAINLCQGIVRARFRDGLERPAPIMPGAVHQYAISLTPTANLFAAGHRIRLEVSSSNFPTFDRNPNTGEPFGQSAATKVATQAVHHGARYPSALILPVQPID